MAGTPINRPGAPSNPPQHLAGEGPEAGEPQPPDPVGVLHRQTGPGTAPPDRDVADPHPSDEGRPYRAHHPGGAHPPPEASPEYKDIGPNPAGHDGSPPPRPHNAGSGAE